MSHDSSMLGCSLFIFGCFSKRIQNKRSTCKGIPSEFYPWNHKLQTVLTGTLVRIKFLRIRWNIPHTKALAVLLVF
jgi:hypothetical protein